MSRSNRRLGWCWLSATLVPAAWGFAATSCVDPDLLCDPTQCSNSPEIEVRTAIGRFHDLNLRGRPNGAGIAIKDADGAAQIYKGAQAYRLSVEDGRLVGTSSTGVLRGADLVGAQIVLYQAPVATFAKHLVLSIAGAREVPMELDPTRTLEVYRIMVDQDAAYPDRYPGPEPTLATPRVALCNPPMNEVLRLTPSIEPGEAVVFRGDKIDEVNKTTSQFAEDDWFNLACAGSTLAKLDLLGETIETQVDPFATASWKERQAMLKMLVADYCGTGESFTVQGAPLMWKTETVPYPGETNVLEARWNEHGAICVQTPRLDADADVSSSSTLGWRQIEHDCGTRRPPPCENSDPNSLDGAVVVSAHKPHLRPN